MWINGDVYMLSDDIRIRPMKWHDLEQIQEKMAELNCLC